VSSEFPPQEKRIENRHKLFERKHMNWFNRSILVSVVFGAASAHAATQQCFILNSSLRPLAEHMGTASGAGPLPNGLISRLIPLSEAMDNAIQESRDGSRICLKGYFVRDFDNTATFFAREFVE
jgi:hypothetical protein